MQAKGLTGAEKKRIKQLGRQEFERSFQNELAESAYKMFGFLFGSKEHTIASMKVLHN